MSEPNPTNSGNLQFDRAEFATPGATALKCVVCQQPIGGTYYQVNANNACPTCLENVRNAWSGGSGSARAARALAFGSVAAALGAGIWFGITALTGYEFGLVAILVGFMVGWAVRRGSGGRGGWFYQLAAIGLTYASIVSTNIPPILGAMRRAAEERQMANAAPTNSATASSATNQVLAAAGLSGASDSANRPATSTVRGNVLTLILIFALACAAPFLGGFQNILGILIIAIALYEAWKLNKGGQLNITGPFEAAASPSGSGPDSPVA